MALSGPRDKKCEKGQIERERTECVETQSMEQVSGKNLLCIVSNIDGSMGAAGPG